MPRARSKKQSAEAELLPPEDNQPSQKVIKHKTEWVEVVEEAPEEIGDDLEDDETEDKPRRKIKSAREELRKKLRAQGVAPSTNLRLYIEKYLHSDSNTGGSYAETEFCTKYQTTEEHILNKDYIDVAKRWGAGKYRITIRMQNKIVDAFDERISATPTGPVIQHVNPNDPTSPQVIVQTTNGDGQQYQPPSMRDIMKAQKEAFKEQLEMAKLMREAYGLTPETPQQQQQTVDPELAALQLITKNPDVMEKIAGGIAKSIFGGKGVADDTPWWADILKDSITTGQLAPTVQGVVRALFPNGLFGGLFPGGNNNGQAQMATAPLQTNGTADSQRATDGRTVVAQEIPQGNQSLQPASGEADQQSGMLPAGQQQITPEQHALARLIQNCQRNVPVQVAYQQLINYADAVNEQAPEYSIDGYIDLLGSMETDQVLEFVKALPGGEQVVGLPHVKEWTAELQRLIKENQEGEE
jgi:hypothetical protein